PASAGFIVCRRGVQPIGVNFGVRWLASAFSKAACCRRFAARLSHRKTVAQQTGASSLGKSGSKLQDSNVNAHGVQPPGSPAPALQSPCEPRLWEEERGRTVCNLGLIRLIQKETIYSNDGAVPPCPAGRFSLPPQSTT